MEQIINIEQLVGFQIMPDGSIKYFYEEINNNGIWDPDKYVTDFGIEE